MKLDIAIKFKSGYAAVTDKDTKAKKENNDCVVRAVMNAFEVSYNEAHKFCEKEFKRKSKKGCSGYCNMIRVVDGDLLKVMALYDNEWGFTNQMIRQILEIKEA